MWKALPSSSNRCFINPNTFNNLFIAKYGKSATSRVDYISTKTKKARSWKSPMN